MLALGCCTESAQHCFTSKTTTHGWSTPKVPQLEKVPVPSEGFMDEDQYIHFVVDITAPKVSVLLACTWEG